MAVEIYTNAGFGASKPKPLFSGYVRGGVGFREYDVSPDGKRFLAVKTSDTESTPAQLNVVVNWLEELKNRSGDGQKR